MLSSYPKISIITPSFNQGQFIEETILSVFNQNYPNLEYIIIDGGSTDNTVDIIKKYNDKITYWVSEKDNGQSHAINKGFKKATGDIVTWLNSDDMLYLNALLTVAKTFNENPSIDFIYGECEEWFQDDLHKINPLPESNLNVNRLSGFPYFQPASFYKRDALFEIGLLDESLNFSMDRDLFLRFILNKEMLKIKQPLAIYRHHDDSKSHNIFIQSHQENLQIISNLYYSIQKEDKLNKLYKALLNTKVLPIHNHKIYEVGNFFTQKEYLLALLLGTENEIKQLYIKGKFKELKTLFYDLKQLDLINLVIDKTSLGYLIKRAPYLPLIALKRKLIR